MFAMVIDKNSGFKTEGTVRVENDKIINYTLKENETYIGLENNIDVTTNFIKAKWNGEKWVEGATDEEIQVFKGKNKPTTQEQINAQLLEEIAQQKIVNAQLMQEIADLKGGNANV